MSENRLILPKQTGRLEPFYASLKIYYEARERENIWVDNHEFIDKICLYVKNLNKNDDGPKLVKQSEITRYFGLVEYDYSSQLGKARITQKGIEFYEAYLSKDLHKQYDIIIDSIFYHSFGRNNTAIKASDSDIDPPKIFIKSILDLDGITRKELAYLLYVTNDLKIEYNDALCELKKSSNTEREIPIELSNKYGDVKFTVFLENIGFCVSNDGKKYLLSKYIKEKYQQKIENLSIYNKIPDIVLTLQEDDESIDTDSPSIDNDIDQNKIISAFTYDILSHKFHTQNDRKPEKYSTITGKEKYKTNSRIAKTALYIQEYKCAINPQHSTFISKAGLPYMEAHHLVPMHAQKDFKENLDRVENILSLCPICHSAIHLGNQTVRMDLLKTLYDKNEHLLKKAKINISFGELFSRYYI